MLRRERGVATAQSSSTPLTACEFVEFAELVLRLPYRNLNARA
jgi:hypothetical protein